MAGLEEFLRFAFQWGIKMSQTSILPEHLQERVRAMPESGYGVNRVTVILDDGTRIDNVHVAWGKEIVKIGKDAEVHFDVHRIVDVESEV